MASMTRRHLFTGLAGAGALSAAGCGTLLYPERRGQKGGRIDPAVAILDGIGLLFFIIPGAVAFAVDFATGAIYLPGTRLGEGETGEDSMRVIMLDGPATPDRLAAAVAQATGTPIDLNQARTYPGTDRSQAAILAHLQTYNP